MKVSTLLAASLSAAALLSTALSTTAMAASDFPEKNVKVIVPFSPGGAVDTINRIIGKHFPTHADGKRLIVENKEGGGAVIGQSFVARAKPDGYTLLAFTSSVVSNPMKVKTDYTHSDFDPIVMYSFEPELLVVSNSSSIKSFADFRQKAQSEQVKLVTPGSGTSHHSAGILLKENHDWNLDFVHTGSAAEQLQMLLGDHVESALLTFGEANAQIEEGKVRPIAVMNDRRLDGLPEVPTFKEEGIEMIYGPFRGLAAPRGVDKETHAKLEKIFTAVLKDDDFIADMEKSGYQVVFGDSQALNDRVKDEATFLEQVLPFLNKDK